MMQSNWAQAGWRSHRWRQRYKETCEALEGAPWAGGGMRRAGSDVPPLAPAAAKGTGTIAAMWSA